MVYRALGLMSGVSFDGLEIAFTEFQESSGKWNFEIKAVGRYAYNVEWIDRLSRASEMKVLDYHLLHTNYGHLIGDIVNQFINENNLQHQVQLIASHGHTVFHIPSKKMTAQLGDGASIAAKTGINTVCNLRSLDIARGGRGAPIVAIGEKYLFSNYNLFLHLGSVARISINDPARHIAFDVCPANKVLAMLASQTPTGSDRDGQFAAAGKVDEKLFQMLNDLEYYRLPYPKYLSSDFGTDVVYTLIKNKKIGTEDALRTYVEHVAFQVRQAIELPGLHRAGSRMLVTGAGAHNNYLIERITSALSALEIELVVPEKNLVDYKETIIMGLIGILRWREEANTLASITGATADSIGGAVWIA